MNIKLFNKFIRRTFSNKWEGIKGDVNWVDGQLIDGRPNLRRHKPNLPKRRYGSTDLTDIDYAGILKELENPIYLTYNHRKRGAGKLLDIPQDKHKK